MAAWAFNRFKKRLWCAPLMARILFLAHRYPYPPNKGDKIRAFHIAEHLRAKHEVALGFTATPGDDEPDMNWAKKFADVYCGRISTADRLVRTGAALLTGRPLSVAAFRHHGLAQWVAGVWARKRPDLVYAFSSAMAQYVPAGAHMIVDFVDVDSEKWRQYGETRPVTHAWFYGMEARRLLAFDRTQAARARASLFVSEDEKRIFDRLSPDTKVNHTAIANGVDIAFFDPAKVRPRAKVARTIVFVGMMDYWPNVDAATWFAKDILPKVRARYADATFQIVGARPVPAVRALAALAGVEVTGAVDDVRPYLAAADVVVAPLKIARGIQNKVLEGMSMARPLVATPGALEGINAQRGRDLVSGATAEEFAARVLSVLDGGAPNDMGTRARAFVQENHDWGANLRKLDELIARLIRRSAEVAADER
jgi:sugar transferase (PEP-CTERM/EpsH1 system associated)